MKKITLKGVFAGLLLLAGANSFAQQEKQLQQPQVQLTEENQRFLEEHGVVRCFTPENELALSAKNSRRSSTEEFEEWIAPIVSRIKADRQSGNSSRIVYNIPVVVHVVHNGDAVGSGENITDAQVLSQISVLNEDFRRLAGTPGGANSTGVAVDVEVNFCMAQTDPGGSLTNGIVRHNIAPYSNSQTPGTNDDWETNADVETLKTNTQWDPTKYMNMWCVKFGGNSPQAIPAGMQGILGYAQFPSNSGLGGLNANGGAANTDGVVAGYQFFGTSDDDDGSFILSAPYDKGRTMTHEVGHYLGLRHIWGDTSNCTGGANAGDYCADTPDSNQSNGGCPTVDNCPADGLGNDQVQNYMDYTNDSCMDTFTQDQKDRIIAVMTNSPRRVELNSSTRCQAPTPLIGYSSATQQINEGTDCGTTDVIVTVSIGKAPTANADVTINAAGTANSDDYQIIGGNLTFPAGLTADQTFTVRINNDSFVEADETIDLTMTLNANGGDATITTEPTQQQTITIVNDDSVPSSSTSVDVYDEDFEDVASWAIYDRDGDGEFWGVLNGLDGYGDIVGRCGFSETDATILGGAGSYTPDQYFVSDSFTIPAGASSASVSYVVGSYNTGGAYQEHYSVYFTTISTPSAYADLEEYVLENDREVPATGTEVRNHDLTAYAGLTGQLVLRHHNTAGNGLLIVDTINVDAVTGTGVQTAVNTGAPDQDALYVTGTVYSADTSSGDMMADIVNNNNVDYGCVSTAVSRASGAAQMYQVAGAANYVMGKTFTITPASVQASGNATVKFYFTEAEIAQWEGDTGNSRNDLRVIKDNGTSESVAAAIGAFGTNVTLEATFTSGINGTYYFGREQALSVDSTDYTLFSVFPNPAQNYLDVILGTNENVEISLFDIRGRKIFTQLENNNNETFTTRLDLEGISSGVYMLNVKSGNKSATKKIVIE